MTLNEYQKKARVTAIYSDPVIYPTLGLAGETGEVAEKVKKVLRDSSGYFSAVKKEEIKKELGDVLWYLANLAEDLGITLDDVAQLNIDKLYDRKDRGVLGGSGDNR